MGIILYLLQLLFWIIIIDAVLSWILPNKDQFPRNITSALTDPLYAPVRAVISPEKTGGIDLSPLVLILLIRLLQSMLHRGGL